jgi:DNA (cytosine-5)-methyltransferase 1
MAYKSRADGGLRELALFAGAGGGILGGKLLGWRTVCAVEWEPYAASVLAARQNDGVLPPFPIWDDVQSFDGRPWRGIVDVVSGGFPCQDISVAGKGAGIDGARSGMWSHMARIIGEVRPRHVFVENSPALLTRGLGRVLGDLAALGYDCRWTVLGAADVGAPHQRDRFWLVANASSGRRGGAERWQMEQSRGAQAERTSQAVANADSMRELQPQGSERDQRGRPCNCGSDMANADSTQRQGSSLSIRTRAQYADACGSSWWQSEPDVGRVAHGVAARVDRLKAIGNGQVPLCAATAWELLRFK